MFTIELIDEIIKKLRYAGVKDSDLSEALLPLEGDELVTVVQNYRNKSLSLEELRLFLRFSKIEDYTEEELIQLGKDINLRFNGVNIYFNTDIPKETDNTIWINPTGSTPIKNRERDADIAALFSTITELKKLVETMSYAFSHVMDPGGIENSTMDSLNDELTELPAWADNDGILDWEESDDDYTGGDVDKEDEPFGIKPTVPNARHILIKAGTKAQLGAHKDKLLAREFFFCEDTLEFYIKLTSGKLHMLNGASSVDPTDPITPDMPDLNNLEKVTFVNVTSNKSTVVEINKEGKLEIYNPLDRVPEALNSSGALTSGAFKGMIPKLHLEKLYINSLYCGGLSTTDKDYNPCSHNFVELSNLTKKDIILDGLSLLYAVNGVSWEVLPLKGKIKSGSTFLIRGAQCGVMDANTTKIKVKTFDMEWKKSDGELIKFDTSKAKFLLTHGLEPCNRKDPYVYDIETKLTYCTLGYVDMIGLNVEGASFENAIDGAEIEQYRFLSQDRLYMKYFTMDPVKQATKKIGARNNSNDWYYVDLTKDIEYKLEEFYTPKCSLENKDIFFNKSNLDKLTPNMVTVTFGLDPHSTRCFNWVSVGLYDEYLYYRKKGTPDWTKLESIKGKSGAESIYNRVRVVATNGTPYTSHKYILKNLAAGEYEYQVGRETGKSEIYTFTVRTKESCNNFGFIHVTDQQGFNRSEYQVWKKAADKIEEWEDNIHFILNTGDMTQNGNRINEWLDYYEGGKTLFSKYEQMNMIGNNDLSPKDFQSLGAGEDTDKMSPINFLFFYCYEIDVEFPPFIGGDYNTFVPSVYSFTYGNTFFLGVNSEITADAIKALYPDLNYYRWLIEWCNNVTTKAKLDPTIVNFIAFTHEAPFTIITEAQRSKELVSPGVESRKGSKLNTGDALQPYSFSQFLQTNGFRLSLCGHKHTYSRTKPLIDDPEQTMRPTIQDTSSTYYDALSSEDKLLCQVLVVSKITAPIYVMCQATGYKQRSNKDMPAYKIPWLESYFPSVIVNGAPDANPGQLYPFYIKWDVSNIGIDGSVYKIGNIMVDGDFNINNTPEDAPIRLQGDGDKAEGETIKIRN